MINISDQRDDDLTFAGLANNPFLAWDNFASGATFSGTATEPGGAGSNTVSGATNDFWLPTVSGSNTATLNLDLGAARAATFFAVAAHNLAEYGATLKLQYSTDGATFLDAAVAPVADDKPVVFRFVETEARYWRVLVSAITAADPIAVGVVFLGAEMIIPARVYQEYTPIIVPNIVTLNSNVSEGGHLMGTSVTTAGATVDLPMRYLRPAFIRGDFLPFMQHFNGGGGLFYAWRPAKYPEDVHYAWRNGAVVQPGHSGIRDLMDFTLAMRVYNDR